VRFHSVWKAALYIVWNPQLHFQAPPFVYPDEIRPRMIEQVLYGPFVKR
jgi:hypothetical protein